MELRDIHCAIRNKSLFHADYLRFDPGDLVALVGKNGSGKSTFLKAVAGLSVGVMGEVIFKGKVFNLNTNHNPSTSISYIPVKLSPFGSINLMDFILSGKSSTRSFMDVPAYGEIDNVLSLLQQFQLQHIAYDAFELLSDGEQKLALIIRSVYRNSEILLLDEPESFLDVGNRKRVFEWLKRLSLSGKIVIFSTHQPELAAEYADAFLCIDQGSLYSTPTSSVDRAFSFLY